MWILVALLLIAIKIEPAAAAAVRTASSPLAAVRTAFL
jgi:hypothetical protein